MSTTRSLARVLRAVWPWRKFEERKRTVRPRSGRPPVRVEPEQRNLDELARRIESDHQFALGFAAISSIVQGANVAVHCPAHDARGRALAANLTQRWREVLPLALQAFGRGRAAFEISYRWDPVRHLHLVAGLDHLEFSQSFLRLSKQGRFAGVKLKIGRESFLLDPHRSWWFALDPTPRNPHGRSRYLGAPLAVWKARRAVERQYNVWLEKFAFGHGVLRAPSEYPPNTRMSQSGYGDTNLDGTPADPLADGERLLQSIRSGGTAILPSECDDHGRPLWSYDPPSGHSDAGPLERRLSQLDAYALRSLGIPERALTQDAATGSYAMAAIHWQVLLTTCEGVLSQLAASFQKHVVETAERINRSRGERWNLKVAWQKLDPQLSSLAVDLVKSILLAPKPSPLVTNGVVDLAKLLELSRLPVGDRLAEKLEKLGDSNGQASERQLRQTTLRPVKSLARMPAGYEYADGGTRIGGGQFASQEQVAAAKKADEDESARAWNWRTDYKADGIETASDGSVSATYHQRGILGGQRLASRLGSPSKIVERGAGVGERIEHDAVEREIQGKTYRVKLSDLQRGVGLVGPLDWDAFFVLYDYDAIYNVDARAGEVLDRPKMTSGRFFSATDPARLVEELAEEVPDCIMQMLEFVAEGVARHLIPPLDAALTIKDIASQLSDGDRAAAFRTAGLAAISGQIPLPKLRAVRLKKIKAPEARRPAFNGPGDRYSPPREISAFAEKHQKLLNGAVESRMKNLGVPDEMIGVQGINRFEESTAFTSQHAIGGSNNRMPDGSIRGGKRPGINVDAAALDPHFRPNTPTWRSSSLRDRIDAVVAHEHAEVMFAADPFHGAMGREGRHFAAVLSAPRTNLRVTAAARKILEEEAALARRTLREKGVSIPAELQ